MLQRLIGSNKLSLHVATAVVSIKVGGYEDDSWFTIFRIEKRVSCIDFAALLLGVQEEMSAFRLSALLLEMKLSLTEEHAKMLIREAAVHERTGISDESLNRYFQQYGEHVGIGCADLQGKEWIFDSDHFDSTAVFHPGNRVIVRSFRAGHPTKVPEHFAVRPASGQLPTVTVAVGDGKKTDVALLANVVFDPGDNPTSFAHGLLDG